MPPHIALSTVQQARHVASYQLDMSRRTPETLPPAALTAQCLASCKTFVPAAAEDYTEAESVRKKSSTYLGT